MVVARATQTLGPDSPRQELQELQGKPAASSSVKQDRGKQAEDASGVSKGGPSSVQPLGLSGASEKDQNNTPSPAVQTPQNDVAGPVDGAQATSPAEDPKPAVSPMTPENPPRSFKEPDSSTLSLSEPRSHRAQLSSPADISAPGASALTKSEADKYYHTGMESIHAGISQLARYHASMSAQWRSEKERLGDENKSLCAYVEELSGKVQALEAQLAVQTGEVNKLRGDRKIWEDKKQQITSALKMLEDP
jgi:hypothetical protein